MTSLHPTQPGFVLVKTQMAENVGASCRSMRCFGFDRLHLVAPREDPCGPGSFAMAAGAIDIAVEAPVHDELAQALDGYRLAVGLTRRSGRWRQLDGPLPQVLLHLHHTPGLDLAEVAFVFGPEATGLANEDLQRCDLLAEIPTDAVHGSLNLAHAVTCVCYELTRQPPQAPTSLPASSIATTTQSQAPEAPQNPPSSTSPAPEEASLSQVQARTMRALMRYLDAVDCYTVPPRDIAAQRFEQMLRRSLLMPRDLIFLEKMLHKLAGHHQSEEK